MGIVHLLQLNNGEWVMSMKKKNVFFEYVIDGELCSITIKNSFLDFEQLALCRDLREIAPGRTFRITGRSSIEAYFCLGFMLTHWHAAGIVGIDAKGKEQLRMDIRDASGPALKKWLSCHLNQRGEAVAEILLSHSASKLWNSDDLELSIPCKFTLAGKGGLHLTGLGSVWMYMHLGVSAALAGIHDVYLFKPQLPYEIHINADGVCEAYSFRRDSKNGVVVGILGDPNSGKSVFSRSLALSIRELMPPEFTSWIYDCDLASPTPEWYLKDCDSKRIIRKRKRIKRDWTTELEEKAATDLENLRCNLDLVLADMPGGKHSDQEHNRIPSATRAAMMSRCDAFIVLCRQDDDNQNDEIFQGWRHALGEYHLENRIIGRLVAKEPDADFSISPLMQEDGLFCATISGLDRHKSREEIVRVMSKGLSPLIRYLCGGNVVRRQFV